MDVIYGYSLSLGVTLLSSVLLVFAEQINPAAVGASIAMQAVILIWE